MKIISIKVPVNDESLMDLTSGISDLPRVILGIQFYDSNNLPVTPSSGTYTITVSPLGTNSFVNIVDGQNIDASREPDPLSFAGNAEAVKYTPNSIVGASEVEIKAIGNA